MNATYVVGNAPRRAGTAIFLSLENEGELPENESAIMINVGDGSVLTQVEQIGVRRLEWVLLTHHHRKQCQGHPMVDVATIPFTNSV